MWEIFYTPHTDDESIGMAGAITRAVDAGRSVLVCLVTDNRPSIRGQGLFPGQDVMNLRRAEWLRALEVLRVTEIQLWEMPEAAMPHHMSQMRRSILDHMISLHQSRDVRLHHTTWGLWDNNAGVRCLAHELCSNAAFELFHTIPGSRVHLHGIYEYSKPLNQRSAPLIQILSAREQQQKRAALEAYCPSDTSIGYGYRSVPELIDAARRDPREFVIEV